MRELVGSNEQLNIGHSWSRRNNYVGENWLTKKALSIINLAVRDCVVPYILDIEDLAI